MLKAKHFRRFWASAAWCLSGLLWGAATWCFSGVSPGGIAHAADAIDGQQVTDTRDAGADDSAGIPIAVGYRSTADADVSGVQNADSDATAGPVRMARFSFVQGTVSWRTDATSEWAAATQNLPLREGAQIWVTNGGRAEIQFDDGSVLRLGNAALVTLETLFSDTDGEFTQIKMNDGLATMRIGSDLAVYQIDTPLISVKANGPSRFRVGVGDGAEVAVTTGMATVEGQQGRVTLKAGEYLDVRDDKAAFEVSSLPEADSFDRWNAERDAILDDVSTQTYQDTPSDIAMAAGNLDNYGTWHNDAIYGHSWCPNVTDTSWRPYCNGYWTWVNPFGWTWVSSEPWGWAPYHYGAWVHEPYGWAWVPGPEQQYWCPAVVSFCMVNGQVVWCPLAPHEVHYPKMLALALRNRRWAKHFSIGQAAVYYPAGSSYCVARPFNTNYVNSIKFPPHAANGANAAQIAGTTGQSVTPFAVNHSGYQKNKIFLPTNAIRFAGATSASLAVFGGHGAYHRLPKLTPTAFVDGHTVATPPVGQPPVDGPPAVQPTFAAMTPLRAYFPKVGPAPAILTRGLYAVVLPEQVDRNHPTTSRGSGQAPTGSIARSNDYRSGSAAMQSRISEQGERRLLSVGASGIDRREIAGVNNAVGQRSVAGSNVAGVTLRPQNSNLPRMVTSAATRAASARASLGLMHTGNSVNGSGGTTQRDINVIYIAPPQQYQSYQQRIGGEGGNGYRATGAAATPFGSTQYQNQNATSNTYGRTAPYTGNPLQQAPQQQPDVPRSSPPVIYTPMQTPQQQQSVQQQPWRGQQYAPQQPSMPRQEPSMPRQEPSMPRQEPSRPNPPPAPPQTNDSGNRGKHP